MRVKWTNRYDSGSGDSAAGITVDSENDILVAGSVEPNGNDDIFVIKYNNSGGVLWSKTYGNSSSETAGGISVGAGNSVYVGGHRDTDGDADYTVLKYSSKGDRRWVSSHDTTGDAFAVDMTSDANGNVYLTGFTIESDGRGDDGLTVRFNSSGGIQWKERYDTGKQERIYRVASTKTGTVYVVGFRLDGTNNYITVKYQG